MRHTAHERALLVLYRQEWVNYLMPSTAPELPNPMVRCACGCGGELRKYDANRRTRAYLRGHGNTTRRKGRRRLNHGPGRDERDGDAGEW